MSTAFIVPNVECIAQTDKAILVEGDTLDEPTWIPQSQVHEDSEVYAKGHKGALHVSTWFAEQRGWE
jgi:hypothetical protein